MSLLPDGVQGRDSNGGSSIDARIVWQVDCTLRIEISQSNGCGEVERTGKFVDEQRSYHVIAPTEALASALWAEQHRFNNVVSGPKFTALCNINGEISYGHR